MKGMVLLVCLLCFLPGTVLAQQGVSVARSIDDLMEVGSSLQQKVYDFNSNRLRGEPWVGVLYWCVCAKDRSKILYTTGMLVSEEDAGTILSRLRGAAKACGGCFSEPIGEIYR